MTKVWMMMALTWNTLGLFAGRGGGGGINVCKDAL